MPHPTEIVLTPNTPQEPAGAHHRIAVSGPAPELLAAIVAETLFRATGVAWRRETETREVEPG